MIHDQFAQPLREGDLVGYTRGKNAAGAQSYVCRVAEIVQEYQWDGLVPLAGRVRLEFVRDAYNIKADRLPGPITVDSRSVARLLPETT